MSQTTSIPTSDQKPMVQYADFAKLDLRVATVVSAELIEGADKLVKLTLNVGELGERVVAAGIREWYPPEQIVGKQIVYLANLEPKMLRGVMSQGMLVAAGADFCVLLQPDKEVDSGSIIR